MEATEPAQPLLHPTRLAVLALLFNAFTWGVSWWPLRQLQDIGLHPLWATVLIFLLAVAVLTVSHPAAWRELVRTRVLWVLVAASGTTNACFNWAVTIGDVVRVVLLFYLMPLWAVLLARWLLGEPLSAQSLLRVGMALAGAMVVLWPADGNGLPLPRNLADFLAVIGGFSFALNNVMLHREARRSSAARSLAMFCGGALVAGVMAMALSARGALPWPPPPQPLWLAGAAAIGLVYLASNLSLQYGAARLPAQITAVVMVSEVLFAAVSALLLGAGAFSLQLVVGGALIVGASLLASRQTG